MPFILIIAGLILTVAGVREKQSDLYTLLLGDFTGAGNFVYWVISILIVGSIGYIKDLKPLSDAFLVLILIVLFLSRKGFYAQFVSQVQSTNTPANKPINSSPNIDQQIANTTTSSNYLSNNSPISGTVTLLIK
jgi:hypothetical protein